MGIPLWELRAPSAPAAPESLPVAEELVPAVIEPAAPDAEVPEPVPVEPAAPAAGLPVAQLSWDELAERVAACRACSELAESRTQTVFGVGNRTADWLIIGEAPGADEDRLGAPFVGRAGKLLDAMLAAIGLDRTRVYIANVLKCRPPGNRDPSPEEAAACLPFLQRQVALLQPKIILAVGRIAAQTLLRTDTPVGKLRGRRHTFPGTEVPFIVTYHPAYLLRSPQEKRKSWADLRLACDVYTEQKRHQEEQA